MREKIIVILASIRPEFDFTASQNFIEDGLLDSFDMISLVCGLDEEFKISINGEDITQENFLNLSAVEALVSTYIGIKK